MATSSPSRPITQKQLMVSNGIAVRRARTSDWPAIEQFLKVAYAELAPYKGYSRWSWQFLNNPYRDLDDNDVPVWIAETDDHRIVGQIAVQLGRLKVDDKHFSAGWIVDVMVLESHRGLQIGHRLYEAVARDCEILVTLTMALATRRMAERLGAVNLTTATPYSRLV